MNGRFNERPKKTNRLREKAESFFIVDGVLCHKIGNKKCRVIVDDDERTRILTSLQPRRTNNRRHDARNQTTASCNDQRNVSAANSDKSTATINVQHRRPKSSSSSTSIIVRPLSRITTMGGAHRSGLLMELRLFIERTIPLNSYMVVKAYS